MHFGGETDELAYGCLFCRSGAEKRIALQMKTCWPKIDFIVPEKKRIRRKNGEALEESVVLFPGYIFLRTTEDITALPLTCMPNLYRLLADSEQNWQLRGADRVLAEKLFQTGGKVGLSTAYYDGDRIRIVDGFLKEYEGQILRVNHRRKTAQICVTIEGKELLVWLGFELINPTDQNSGECMDGGK